MNYHSYKQNSIHTTKIKKIDDFLGIVIVQKSFFRVKVILCVNEKWKYHRAFFVLMYEWRETQYLPNSNLEASRASIEK